MDVTAPDTDRQRVAAAVAAGRLGYGSLMVLAPRRMLRLQAGVEPQGFAVWMGRAFGVRDALLGAGALLAGDDTTRRGWVSAGLIADACDFTSALFGVKWLGRRNAAVIGVVAASATAAQAWSLMTPERR